MDKWFNYHKKTIKRIGLTVVIISLVFYAFLVWDINYLFKRNYFDEGFRDVALNEPFEYRGMELTIKGIRILTPQQVVEEYGNLEEYMYDMEGNTVTVEAVDPLYIYVIIRCDMKKIDDKSDFYIIDAKIYDEMSHGAADPNIQRLLIKNEVSLKHDMAIGDTIKDSILGFAFSSLSMEEKYVKDPTKDKIFMALPAYEPDMKPIRIRLN